MRYTLVAAKRNVVGDRAKGPEPEGRARSANWRFDESGNAAVEFALILPMLAMLLTGILALGGTLNNNEMLTGAVNAGARQLALSRGAATPYASTVSFVRGAAGGLDPAQITINLSVNGQSCTGDDDVSACGALLTAGVPATVTASYPCSVVIMGIDYAPNCVLTNTATGRVE